MSVVPSRPLTVPVVTAWRATAMVPGAIMSIDHEVSVPGLRASLTEQFAVQTARLKELTEMSADTGDPGEAHNRAALVTATRHSLQQVTDALRRMAEGSYGSCGRCGAAIPAERLEVLPYARFCVPCQEKHGA